jgi:glycosyltransferase involved in cell wall biosynthesis
MTDIRLCFSYKDTGSPWNGTNTFTRALREHLSRMTGFSIVHDLFGDYDMLFMNELSRGPGSPYALSEIRAILDGSRNKKLVVRAINLKRNHHFTNHADDFLGDDPEDRATLDLLNMADLVIFQSTFQKGFFDRFGYRGKKHKVIHNGASSVFLGVPGGAKGLEAKGDLILVSAAMATISTKRQDIIARLSLVPGVRVIHSGVWPENLDRAKVDLAGVLSHDEMARLYERGHYFLHPAVHDACPNSLIEGLCAGLPAIYNPGLGSGRELGGKFGIPLDENDLPGTVARAREEYERLATALAADRHYYSIERAAPSYINVFETVAKGKAITAEPPLRMSYKSP